MTTLDRVFVRNADGKPLTPTKRFTKVRKMLKRGDAIIYSYEPFTIQLVNQKEVGNVQGMSLGVDVGSKHIGLSVNDGTCEHLGEQVDVLEDESLRISKRREARRARRHYTTWHRKPRFNNRRRPEGWLPPSIQHKLDTHVDAILNALENLPIDKVTIEVPCFDTHKMVNPDVQGAGYQNGSQKGYKNVRDYVLDRDGHTCQVCGSTKHLKVHHIESRLSGGDAPNNLVTLCDTCHDAYHLGKINLDNIKRGQSLKHASQASVIGAKLVDVLCEILPENVELLVTDGLETARIREALKVEKTHVTDAGIIAGGDGVESCSVTYRRKKVRRHNRHYYKANLLKGGRKKRNTGLVDVQGFRRFDVVRLDGAELCYVDGLRKSGFFKLRRFDGSLVVTSSSAAQKKDSSVSWKRLELVNHSDGYVSWRE